MSNQGNKKPLESWLSCEKCYIQLNKKDWEKHANDCPPNLAKITYSFIQNENLYGTLDVKSKEVSETDSKVFLSQHVMELCSLVLGDWVAIKFEKLPSVAKQVWPSSEKTSTSVLLTELGLKFSACQRNSKVMVSKLPQDVSHAGRICLVISNGQKSLEITSELSNRIRKTCLNRFFCVGNKIGIMYFGKLLEFKIKNIEGTASPCDRLENAFDRLTIDNSFYKIVDETVWKLYKDDKQFKDEEIEDDPVAKIGGLDEELMEVRDSLNACLRSSHTTYGLRFSKSILLYGNSGTGKTMLAKALAQESRANVVSICAPDLYSEYCDNPEETIKCLFKEAQERAPSIIILDEVDILCPTRSQRMTDSEKRVISTMLNLMDHLNQLKGSPIFILGTTNKLDGIDPAFRRHGRFDREVEIGTPNPKARKKILMKLLNGVVHSLIERDLDEISLATHGFVGADLASLCSRSGLNALKNKSKKINLDDFKLALKYVRPSAMREVQVEVAAVQWSDIGGQEKLKLILQQAVEWPLKHPESFVRLGITPPKGVLMFGPPGCSKTMIAKALATESGLNFLSIKGPELFSKWVGESEKAVREVFRKARQVAPSIIFFDEIDALGGERSSGSSTSVQERVLAQLLTELDGISPLGDVTILAATNRPDRIDKALLRPGRLDRIVYVPLPDTNTRREIFKIKLKKMPVDNVDIETLVVSTEGYSGAEVNAVCHEAAMMALEESLEAQYIRSEHFQKALELIVPRTPSDLIKLYENYTNKRI